MGKAKTSPKQRSFSIDDMSVVSTKETGKRYSPTAKLRNVDFTIRALAEALLDGDAPAVKEIIRNHFEAVNTAKALKEAHIKKRTFYDAVSPEGNPSLKTLTQIIHAMRPLD